jgi:hypothetical protein
LEKSQVAFKMNLFCVLALAFLPAFVKAQGETLSELPLTGFDVTETPVQDGDITGEKFEIALEVSGSYDALKEGSVVIKNRDSGSRRMNTVPIDEFDTLNEVFVFNPIVTIVQTGNAHKITLTMSVGRKRSEVRIPITISHTANGSTKQCTFAGHSEAADPVRNPARTSGKLWVPLSGLCTDSALIQEVTRFTKFSFFVTVLWKNYFIPVLGGGKGSGNGIALGDPHFRTWKGSLYDYQGQCELVLLHAPRVDLDVHIRTKILGSYSYIER